MKKIYLFLIVLIAMVSFDSFEQEDSEKESTKAGRKMQDFVINLSKYARKFDPTFIVIPQNGSELVFQNVQPNKPYCKDYLNAIDGIAIEELFYDENGKADDYRINNLKKIVDLKKIFVSEFIKEPNDHNRIIELNQQAGFVPFIRSAENYHYHLIPEKIINENTNDIRQLSEVQNFLYLINVDDFETKNELIKEVSNTNYDLILIDLYYFSFPFTQKEIDRLQTKRNGKKRLVICYLNIGAAENWRNYWQSDWKLGSPKWLKKNYKGYDNEIYVQFWDPSWQKIVFGNNDSYLKKIVDAGFDGVFLDNVEAYYALYH